MFPGVSGFEWSVAHVIFLGAFFTVLVVILSSLTVAAARYLRAWRERRAAAIRWHAEFEELPPAERLCRHALTGIAPGRLCERGFDCRTCAEHPALAAREEQRVVAVPNGIDYSPDRYYHRGHAWVEPQADGTVLVGMDELAERLAGPAATVELPPPGAVLDTHSVAWQVQREGAVARVLAPISGRVEETGSREQGWLLRIRPLGKLDLRHLLHGPEVAAWFQSELERLQGLLAPAAVGPTLADGGLLVDDLPTAQPEADWDHIYSAMFLRP